MNNNNTAGQVRCGVCGNEIDPNDWHPCTPSPEPARLTPEEIISNNIDWDSSSHSRMYYSGIIAAMEEYAQSRIATLKTENETLNKFLDEATENHHKLIGLLHTQVTKRAHDQNAHPTDTEAIWQRYCEENGIIAPPTDTPPLP